MFLSIALLLCLQNPSGNDIPMIKAEHDFILEAFKVERLNDVLPNRQVRWLKMLGCNHYLCREEAAQSLLEHDSISAILWGFRSTDAEVKARCRILLQEKYVCIECGGSGICVICKGTGTEPGGEFCVDCIRMQWFADRKTVYYNPTLCRHCSGSGNPSKKDSN